MEIKGTNISMRKGNTENLSLSITLNGVAAPFVNGDVVKLALKSHINDPEPVLAKTITTFTDGKAIINFTVNDTKDLKPKEYVYDALIIYANGKVFNFIEVSTFEIKPVVTM